MGSEPGRCGRLRHGDDLAAAFAIGSSYEATLDPLSRKRGAHYTPPDTALGLAARALNLAVGAEPRVVDPTCGGGAFLVAAAEHLARRGADPERIVRELLIGVDIDPGAVAASRRALRRWAEAWGVEGEPQVFQADVAELGPQDLGPRGVQVVLGNPPFGGQLAALTARDQERRDRWRRRFGPAAGRYVDEALLVALVGRQLLGPGGVLAMVLPCSALASTDGSAARRALLEGAAMTELWVDCDRVFSAQVDVCAPFIVVDGARGPVLRWSGRKVDVALGPTGPPEEENWAGLLVDADAPSLEGWRTHGAVGDRAEATAGFRDQYYGLCGHVRDERPDGQWGRLVTVGLIDPGICHWGNRGARFDAALWSHPHVDLDSLERERPTVAAWYRARQVPKVLVATQSQVVEAAADTVGDLLPLTPVISVEPLSEVEIHRIAAVLSSPVATRWAVDRASGRGLSQRALRLTARDCQEMPWPADHAGLDRAAGLLQDGDLVSYAHVVTEAYGLPSEPLVRWWLARLPRARRGDLGVGERSCHTVD
jgi:hypothetical protein